MGSMTPQAGNRDLLGVGHRERDTTAGPSACRRWTGKGVGAAAFLLLLFPFLTACRGAGEDGSGSAAGSTREPDSLAEAILGADDTSTAPSDQRNPADPPIPLRRPEQQSLRVSQMGYNQGSSDAPVKVIELSDFGCGYCRRFHEETYPVLKEAYVDTGLVEWKFVPFVLGMFPNGLEAAEAAECAGEQDRFFSLKERLFQDQRGWRGAEEPNPHFTRLAREEGLDADRFGECIREDRQMERVQNNIRLGAEMGVRGTPTFVVAGVPLRGALPLATFRDVLDMVLEERGVTPPERDGG